MNRTRIILVGGFLGSGKTTLIWKVAGRLMASGKHVGLVTNDQAPELVDSELLRRQQLSVSEVAGSCFCCNFNGFTEVVKTVRDEAKADIVMAEPVGSCADLSATILQPLKKYWNTELEVSPLTVLADPSRLESILHSGKGGLHEDAAYIFRKQLEEADIIVITKTDTLTPEHLAQLKSDTKNAFPKSCVMSVCALSGEGIDEWLEEVTTKTEAGTRLLDIDYDRYANGEAVLGWLNGTISLSSPQPEEWDGFLNTLMLQLNGAFEREALPVGHVKVIAENGKQYSIGNITGADRKLTLREGAGKSTNLRLIINARVECSPEHLDHLVRDALIQSINGRYYEKVNAWRYLQPGRPNPTHRFDSVVK
ncbi:MAG: cobalamin synthesis protein P47K [Prevotella sp.]|nr:cobalamin synthesis protein P47K [Prevotella sp.]